MVEALAPFRHADFRRYWVGNIISLIGTQMTGAAIAWQVYQLADPKTRGFAAGAIGLSRAVPLMTFALLGGPVADAVDRRRLLFVTQACFLVIALVLAFAAHTKTTTLPLLYALSAVSGLLLAFDLPARQSLVPNLVPREILPRALTFQIYSFELAVLIGPLLGTLVLDQLGAQVVFALDALTFGAMLVGVASLSYRRPADAPPVKIGISAALEGIAFVWRTPALRVTALIDFIATILCQCTQLMPIFARDLLHVDVKESGALFSAPALGAIVAALVMVRLPTPRRQGAIVLVSVAIYGLATAAFGISTYFPVAVACLALAGAADTVSTVIRHTLRQELTPDDMRGRMNGVNMIFFVGGPLLGEFRAGSVASLTDPRTSVFAGGVACAVVALLYAVLVPWLRGYVRSPEAGRAK